MGINRIFALFFYEKCMSDKAIIAALFDLDGVVVDTEKQYSLFWHQMGVEYVGIDDLEIRIKGQTLKYIFETFFGGMTTEQLAEITERLDAYELQMQYDYVPGVVEFIEDLRRHEVKLAVVTSSNEVKMQSLYKVHPELKSLFDRILTAEMFTASKPAPDCFLLGMELFGATPENTFVFEDSFNGLKAGRASGAKVVGLTTTNSRESIAPLCDMVLDDFAGFTFDQLLS